MLDFFRKNAVFIALAIVLFFAGTMFSGAFLFGGLVDTDTTPNPAHYENAVAVIGDIPIPTPAYTNQIQQQLQQLSASGQDIASMDPEILEFVKWNSFKQAADYVLIAILAKKDKVKASKAEIKAAIDSIISQQGLENKKQLKQRLAELGLPYDKFLEGIERDIQVQKWIQSVQSSIIVTDSDVKNSYIETELFHILIEIEGDKESEAFNKALDIQAQIANGLNFKEAAKRYSQDHANKEQGGYLGWAKYGQFVESFENAMYSLEKNEVSAPIRSPYGLHLIKVTNRRQVPLPEDFEIEKEKEALRQRLISSRIAEAISILTKGQKPELKDPHLRAISAKLSGDADTAIAAYTAMSSQAPSNPVPHYLLAKLHKDLGNKEAALRSFEKADILTELIPSPLPYIHEQYGKFLEELGKNKEAKAQFKKAKAKTVVKSIEEKTKNEKK